VAEIVAGFGDFGQFKVACLSLLTAAARGDVAGAERQLLTLRGLLRVTTVDAAVSMASQVLAAGLPAEERAAG
jgi:hypothetical protein